MSHAPAGRIRIHGTAEVLTDDANCAEFLGAEAVVRVTVGRKFQNCARYIHDLANGTISESAPREGHTPPEPEWKSTESFVDVVPTRSVKQR